MMKPWFDIHIHSYLSPCSGVRLTQTLQTICDHAAANGLKTVGIADHFWDERAGAAPGFYGWLNLDRTHISRIRGDLAECNTHGVKVLFGCESEYCNGRLGFTEETAKELDFVLMPFSHIHLDFVMSTWQYRNDDRYIAEYMLAALRHIVSASKPTAIAHPFACGIGGDRFTSIMRRYDEKSLGEVFTAAADKGIAMELNMSCLSSAPEEAWVPAFSLMKECGCRFTTGTDAHEPKALDLIGYAEKAFALLNLTENDILHIGEE